MSGILSVVVRWINYDISIGWSFLTARDPASSRIVIERRLSSTNRTVKTGLYNLILLHRVLQLPAKSGREMHPAFLADLVSYLAYGAMDIEVDIAGMV